MSINRAPKSGFAAEAQRKVSVVINEGKRSFTKVPAPDEISLQVLFGVTIQIFEGFKIIKVNSLVNKQYVWIELCSELSLFITNIMITIFKGNRCFIQPKKLYKKKLTLVKNTI